MKTVMNMLDIKVGPYDKTMDPIFAHCTALGDGEEHTTNQPSLKTDASQDCNKSDLNKSDEKSVLCDKVSNKEPPQCHPAVKKEASLGAFSIDEILQTDRRRVQNPPPQQQPPQTNFLFSRDSFFGGFASNLLQYQFLGAYSDFVYYPYQTSFLYPGLHSIINPVHEIMEVKPKVEDQMEPSCGFCGRNYDSACCLFYAKSEPVFVKQKLRYSKLEQREKPNVCLCCDYTTDEDDYEQTEEDKEQKGGKVQAGWFGKGCRKNRRLKKK